MKRVLSVFSFAVFSMFAAVCTASAYPPIYIVVKNRPYTEGQLQKYAPKGYDCGYVMKDPYGSFLYGIFLVKEEAWMDEVIKFKEFKEDSKEDDADILVCIDGNGAEGEPIDILRRTKYIVPLNFRLN